MFLNHTHQAAYLNHIWIIYKTRGAPIGNTQAKKNSANINKLIEIKFFSQTKKTSIIALDLSVQHKLGGRDALIIANFLANKVSIIYLMIKNS